MKDGDSMGFAITDESQLIDIEQIERGCIQIEGAARTFSQVGNAISGVVCGRDVLSVNGATMQYRIDGLGSQVSALEGKATSFTADIRSQAQAILQRQKAELEAYRKYQAELAKAAEQQNNN